MKKILLTTAIAAMSTFSVANAETLRIATDGTYPPFSELGGNGELTGFDIDIAMALCKQMEVECEIKQIDWDGLIPALKTNKIDAIVASMNATDERRKSVTFSAPYYTNPGVFVRPQGTDVEISEEGLKGKVLVCCVLLYLMTMRPKNLVIGLISSAITRKMKQTLMPKLVDLICSLPIKSYYKMAS